MTSDVPVGRPRNSDIDVAVLDAARQHLAAHGYEAMSLVAIARDAGTTRQAIYRRWPSKADLATDAIASMRGEDDAGEAFEPSDDPYGDLVAELTGFRRGVTRPHGVSLVGTMLLDGADPELVALYRSRVVEPRRRRIRAILDRAVALGQLDADADLDLAVATCTGTLYALTLAGKRIGTDWPNRTAALVWRAAGGT